MANTMPRTPRILQSPNTATTAPPPEVISVESDFVVILAALLCALICVLGFTAIIRCNWLRRGTVAGTSPVRALANKGLKKKVLNSLPKFTYVVDGGSLTGGKWVPTSECAICLSDFSAGDEVRVLPQCGHGFHVSCIDTWLGSHSSCPSCRAPFAVAKCQKCGHVPVVAGGGSVVSGETEYKFVGSDNATVNCNNSNCVGNHHHNVVNNNNNNNNSFLP